MLCMHVDTGTDLDLVFHLVVPQSEDKSILGSVSSLKQGSKQDFIQKRKKERSVRLQMPKMIDLDANPVKLRGIRAEDKVEIKISSS